MATPRKPKRVNASYLKKVPSEVHQAFAEYIFNTTGTEVNAEVVALVQRLYPLYLKSPAVVEAREKAKAEREAEAARKAAEKAQRVKERLAKLDEQRQKLLAELGLEGEPAEAEVIDAADRFETSDEDVDLSDDEPETEEAEDDEPEDDDEPEAEEVTLPEDEDEEDDDLWEDEDDSEDDEEDF